MKEKDNKVEKEKEEEYKYYRPLTPSASGYLLERVYPDIIKPVLGPFMIKLLADVFESIIGAIFVDSEYNYEILVRVVNKVTRLDTRVSGMKDIYEMLKMDTSNGQMDDTQL